MLRFSFLKLVSVGKPASLSLSGNPPCHSVSLAAMPVN